ncbi:MAG TPA: hypothetical protein VH281_01770, partial [Gaiellaceae bacterium]
LRVYEGKPHYCGNIGDAPVIRKVTVHGKTAVLYDWGARSYFIAWREHRVSLAVETRDLSKRKTISIARGLRLLHEGA